ncbi:thiopurine S-methyltransferase [Aliiglaciecola sp. LCG003]|uniref:thiopurine S-methyltransferase n=1 Tax=Aliiglaciecola sp. LCG003 TaxID=3053655 RepID=UPI0025729607|nr:thiopurine S-methyltransferase [Aliiglaciecola sp. LCG003]WJG11205.1 thiopurine S-methyltransferase [Aliiglaciecola sp. LCG003]
MQPDFWHRRWEKNEIGFHLNEANPLLVKYYQQFGLDQHKRIFLPLCGKTNDIAWLLSHEYKVVGCELNESAIQQLFTNLGVTPEISSGKNHKHYHADDIDIYVCDFFELSAEIIGPVDGIYDRAALVALPEAMRVRYTKHLIEVTANAAQFLLCFVYDQDLAAGPPFSVNSDEVKRHYSQYYDIELVGVASVKGGLKGVCPADENVWVLHANR